jgi:acyl-coenzyme A thioesterase PaaI-like protein
MTRAIFEPRADGTFVPTLHAQGPWADGLLHGGPVNGLLARALEQTALERGLDVVRITVDLFRPVPMRPLRVVTKPVRAGRRILVLDAWLLDTEVESARATGLLLRPEPEKAPPLGEDRMPPPPDDLPTTTLGEGMKFEGPRREGFHTTAQARWALPPQESPRSTVWFHIPIPLVAGEKTSPLVQLAAVADFTNALTIRPGPRRASFINADTTIYLCRPPRHEWFCLDVDGRDLGPGGLGYAHCRLYDRDGLVGMAQQAVLPQEMR